MLLWTAWRDLVLQLRTAFARTWTFLWFAAAIAAACVRPDLAGVTSYVRAPGLRKACYDSLLDKMVSLALLLGVGLPSVLVADAYYASRQVIGPLLRAGWHLVSSVRTNAVAYRAPEARPHGGRGRKRVYGEKVLLRTLFADEPDFTETPSPVYGETGVTVKYFTVDLYWRPVGIPVRFVLVIHPT